MIKTLDLNIFYREDWDEETDTTTWADTLTIDVYIREQDQHGLRNRETGMLIECTPEETAVIAPHYPDHEYGTDWWDFADNFLEFAPARVSSLIKSVDIDKDGTDVTLNYTNSPPDGMLF
jgi:hypothetical protein